MRVLVAILLVTVVGGCTTMQTYRTVTVPPEVLRTAIETPTAVVRDDTGNVTKLDRVQVVVLPGEAQLFTVNSTIAGLASACREPSQACPLDQRQAHAQLMIPTGIERHVNYDAIVAWSVTGALAGGVVGGEVYCFARCSTGVKISLGVIDAVSALFVYAFAKILSSQN